MATSRILRSFNRNRSAIFPTANLLTGLLNMIIHTLDVSAVAATGILVGYEIILASIAIGLDTWSIPREKPQGRMPPNVNSTTLIFRLKAQGMMWDHPRHHQIADASRAGTCRRRYAQRPTQSPNPEA
jgi:hypothetical protein